MRIGPTGLVVVLASVAAATAPAAWSCSSGASDAGQGSARGMIAVDGAARKGASCSLAGAGVDQVLRLRLDDGALMTIPLQQAGVYYSKDGRDRGQHIDCEEARSDASGGDGFFKGSLRRRCAGAGTPAAPAIDLSVVLDCGSPPQKQKK